MMKNGILHSAPDIVMDNYGDLFVAIEECVRGGEINRFVLFRDIFNLIGEILTELS